MGHYRDTQPVWQYKQLGSIWAKLNNVGVNTDGTLNNGGLAVSEKLMVSLQMHYWLSSVQTSGLIAASYSSERLSNSSLNPAEK